MNAFGTFIMFPSYQSMDPIIRNNIEDGRTNSHLDANVSIPIHYIANPIDNAPFRRQPTIHQTYHYVMSNGRSCKICSKRSIFTIYYLYMFIICVFLWILVSHGVTVRGVLLSIFFTCSTISTGLYLFPHPSLGWMMIPSNKRRIFLILGTLHLLVLAYLFIEAIFIWKVYPVSLPALATLVDSKQPAYIGVNIILFLGFSLFFLWHDTQWNYVRIMYRYWWDFDGHQMVFAFSDISESDETLPISWKL